MSDCGHCGALIRIQEDDGPACFYCGWRPTMTVAELEATVGTLTFDSKGRVRRGFVSHGGRRL